VKGKIMDSKTKPWALWILTNGGEESYRFFETMELAYDGKQDAPPHSLTVVLPTRELDCEFTT